MRRIRLVCFATGAGVDLAADGSFDDDDSNRVPAFVVRTPIHQHEFVAGFCGAGDLPDRSAATAIMAAARARLNIPRTLDSATERAWTLDSATADDGSDAADETARVLLSFDAPYPVETVRRTLDEWRRRGITAAEQFQRITDLLGAGCRETIVFAHSASEPFAVTLTSIVGTVEHAPNARLMVVTDDRVWTELAERLDPHAAALLRDGRIDPPAPPESRTPAAEQPSVEPLAQLAERAHAAVERASATPPADAAAQDEARSLAEALLAAALARDPRTAGLFRLNAQGGFRFGPRAVEIDLFCPSLAIAVEVDGYFHFQDKLAYRRDRAKDWLMQRHGYLVLRFLAEDVTDRLAAVVERVADAVAHRRDPTRRQ